jgi:hypothetical protein
VVASVTWSAREFQEQVLADGCCINREQRRRVGGRNGVDVGVGSVYSRASRNAAKPDGNVLLIHVSRIKMPRELDPSCAYLSFPHHHLIL